MISKVFNIDFYVNCSDMKVKVTRKHNDLFIVHLLISSHNGTYSPLDVLIDYVGYK